jgi:hypothetical protein
LTWRAISVPNVIAQSSPIAEHLRVLPRRRPLLVVAMGA